MRDNKNHYVLIMAGGIGSRFWPESRKGMPKQFIDILGTGESLLAATYRRFLRFIPEENILIITNVEYVQLVRDHIPGIKSDCILAEPQARNTAPCIAYASFVIKSRNPDAICVVAPSDHLITDEMEFQATIEKSYGFAGHFDCLITLGIKPSRPDTGYGYIQMSPISGEEGFHEVKTFTEKPTAEIAQTFVESGEFLWNAGIFCWNVKAIIERFERYLPEIYSSFAEIDFSAANVEKEILIAYSVCPSISIDYAVMEQDKNVYVYPSSFGWNDLGTWKSLWDVSDKDVHQNAIIGRFIKTYDTKDSLIYSHSGRLVITNGISNLVIVDSGDVLLIIDKDKEQELRKIVNDIKEEFDNKYS